MLLKNKPVFVVDPDLKQRTLVNAWVQSIDKKTGDHLVVLENEQDAQRRIPAQNVFTAPVSVPPRA